MTENSEWLRAGKGIAPQLRWSFTTDAPLVCLSFARETRELFAADASGGIYRLDRGGRIISLTRGLRDVRGLAWSDNGSAGAVLVGESQLCRFTEKMELTWSMDLSDTALAIAIAPYGQYIAVSLASGKNLILDSRKRKTAVYETIRPVSFLRFLVSKPEIIGAAEYGLLCRHHLNGTLVWSEKIWANVGDLSVSGDGETIMTAGFNHGIQTYDAEGSNRASYILEGTAKRVSTSYTADRVVASTVERHLYWSDSDGELLWATRVEEDIGHVVCDPLGEWIVCGFESGRLVRLDWESD